ncbi:MAG: 16S rRNA (cytosine(967)-C(5))-methyltransferase RsmB [Verrucomicrobiota bacterium]
MDTENPREIAIKVLSQRGRGGQYVEKLLEKELARRQLSGPDRALCQELVFGIVRWQRTLDWLIGRKTGGRDQNAIIRLLLQMGLYQLFWLKRVPDHAAVHETVELGKRLGFGQRAGLLNAVLRGYIREREDTRSALEGLKETEPSVGYSHPDWLVERWQGRWGRETTARLLDWNNTPPAVWARLNGLKTDFAGLSARWQKEGIEFVEERWDWTEPNLVFELRSHPPLAECESFQEGLFYVQDPGTLLAVAQMAPQPGETVLDLCAGPGGKTTYIAQRMGNRGRVVARDIQPARLEMVAENCRRLGATCVQTSPAPGEPTAFDRILIDAPCSNTGVMRRRVELRWRLQPAGIEQLGKGQMKLLAQAAPQLAPGGRLVYSTCSLEPEENEEVVKGFLAAHPAFQLESQRQLLPFADGVDGAYVAVLRGE